MILVFNVTSRALWKRLTHIGDTSDGTDRQTEGAVIVIVKGLNRVD